MHLLVLKIYYVYIETNYVLFWLQVGPKKKNLKVKDFDKYDFKPQELVANICKIYLNLGDCDSFCQAVSRDGRSYSHDLFVQAEKVLHKIRQPQDVIGHFTELGAKVKVRFHNYYLFLFLGTFHLYL